LAVRLAALFPLASAVAYESFIMFAGRYRVKLKPQLLVAVTLLLLAALSSSAQACPTCGAGMSEAGEAGQKMLSGWFWSIVFMMSMPFAILGTLGGYMYWIVRKARRAQAAEIAEALPLKSDTPVAIPAMQVTTVAPSSSG
jgi:heme/copper-type cytochrome/quinol oxidase subunit 2